MGIILYKVMIETELLLIITLIIIFVEMVFISISKNKELIIYLYICFIGQLILLYSMFFENPKLGNISHNILIYSLIYGRVISMNNIINILVLLVIYTQLTSRYILGHCLLEVIEDNDNHEILFLNFNSSKTFDILLILSTIIIKLKLLKKLKSK